MRRRALIVVLAVACATVAIAPAAAQAHATLDATTPERGSVVTRAPAQVVFRFDESVDASLGAVKVFDSHGDQVQDGTAFRPGGRGDEVAVRLPRNLHGGYTATYHVISADSHPVSGGFTFAVGRAGAAGGSVEQLLRGQTSGPVTGTAFSVVRGVAYAAIALGLGAVVFLLACWLPGVAAVAGAGADWDAAASAFAARVRALLLLAAGAGVVSAALAILLEGAEGEGSSLWASARPAVVGDVLTTRFGAAWLGALVVWLLVAAAVTSSRAAVPVLRRASVGATGLALPSSRGRILALAAPLAALTLLPSLAGHASVQSPVWLLLPANVLHVAAMAAWLGGIALLVLALRRATTRLEPADRTHLLVAVVSRFSVMAGVAFAVLLASGVIQGVVEVASFGALLHTAFGRAVLIKVVLFIALVLLGRTNRSRVLPALRAARSSPARAGMLLRRTLRVELAVGVVVLGVTGALAGYAPSKVVASGPVTREADVGPAHLQATVDPARIGRDQVHLYLFDRRSGAQYTRAKEVTLSASLPSKGIGELPLEVHLAGPGHYIGAGTLGVAGDWRLTATVRVSAFDEYVAHLTVPIH